jgi:hypothetical protein
VNRAIARFGIALLVLYTAVFAQLNNLQLFGAKRPRTSNASAAAS